MAGVAFVTGFVVFGVMYSFGVFFGPLAAEFHASRAATSALFSAIGFAFYMIGPVAGHMGDRFGPGVMAGAGAILMGAGLALTAFIDRLWIGYLTYGVAVGLGAACAYLPTLAIIGGWFDTKRGTALGIAAAGSGCGMMVVPPLTANLIALAGWRLTDVVLGVACAILLAGCAIVVRPPPVAPSGPGRALSRVVFSFKFAMLYVSWVLATIALFVPFVFLPAYATSKGFGQTAASALLSIIGGMSVVGRAGIGAITGRVGMPALFKASVFVMAASYLLWLTLPGYGGLIAFTVVLGVAYGIRIALMPGVLIELFGLSNLGAILGVFFTGTGIASIVGPLIAGVIVDRAQTYLFGIVFALVMGVLGFLAIAPLKITAETVSSQADGETRPGRRCP
jgi:MFS family permease